MYVYTENPPFIVIELDDNYVFINGKTKEATEEYYSLLINKGK